MMQAWSCLGDQPENVDKKGSGVHEEELSKVRQRLQVDCQTSCVWLQVS